MYAGTHVLEPGVDHFTCREWSWAGGAAGGTPARAGLFPLDVDGDALGDVPVAAASRARALRVRAPVTPALSIPPEDAAGSRTGPAAGRAPAGTAYRSLARSPRPV